MKFTDSKGIEYDNLIFLDKGGMGRVYKGISPVTNEPIVLKLIEHIPDSTDEKQKRELKVSNIISHKNVVKILDSGITTLDGIEYLYLLENFYSNGSLTSKIRKGISINECYQMMYDLLLGMQEIHKTVIHRDLKPDNILIDDDGTLVISDFGLARFITDATQTETFKGWGTFKYMSPESWMYEKNTPAMDIYSLGLIFFEIITGESPFHPEKQTREAWRECHLYSNVPDISKYRNDTNVKLNQVIQKMTAKRLSERYKSIDKVIEAFLDARKQSETSASAIELLARKANSVFEKQTAEELKQKKELEEKNNYIAFLNQHVDDLFNRVVSFVEQINAKLETGKYHISRKKPYGQTTRQSLTVSLAGKSFTIDFLNYDAISLYDKQKEKEVIEWQKQRYRFVMQGYEGSYFSQNDIVLIGLAETSFKLKEFEFGFNLFLKKSPESNYGEWFICQFSKNETPAKTPFGISLNQFFSEYEKLEHAMFFTKKEKKLDDNDLLELIQNISN